MTAAVANIAACLRNGIR